MAKSLSPTQVVESFWAAMNSNDFSHASTWLSEDIICDWILSNERIVGRDNFVDVNTHYPANGRWEFSVKSLVAQGNQVVTDIDVTDGTVSATAVTFHTVEHGMITHQKEYWVEPYPAQKWRAQWTQPIVNHE